MKKTSNVLLYGAVTKAPISACNFSSKQILRKNLERILFRLNFISKFNYRNYVTRGTYNLGDNAIAIAVTQQIKLVSQEINIDMVDWGYLESSKIHAPILFSGSGYYFIESLKNPSQRISSDTAFIKQNDFTCSYFGVGVNYVGKKSKLALEDITKTGQKLLANSLSIAKTISVRDSTSKAILQPLTTTKIVVTGDPALFIKSDRMHLGKSKKCTGELTIGINIPFHGPAANSRISKNIKEYIRFFKGLQQRTGCLFIQTIHYQSEIFIGKIFQDQGIRLTQVIGDVKTLLNAYQQMDLHIGGMLHSCILSASVGTPCIGLAYDIKHQGFFDILGLPDFCISTEPFDPERLNAACEHVLSQNNEIRDQINARRDELEVKSNLFLTDTLQLLLS